MKRAEASAAAPLCVVGMHRSGTSLTARMLAVLGVDFGGERSLFAPDPVDNPDGYGEQRPFVELDDELLHALGGHASEPPAPAGGWEREEAIGPYLERAHALTRSAFSREPWGFKDPRASLLVPFWQLAHPELRFVVCVRNPAEVAESMARRGDPYSFEHWVRSWLTHTTAALEATAGADRAIVVYEDLMREPAATAAALARLAFGDRVDAVKVAAAGALANPARRRSAIDDERLLAERRVPRAAAQYYFAVRDLARKTERAGRLAAVR